MKPFDFKKTILLLLVLLLTTQAALASDYIVGVGDVLTVSVYDHADLTTTSRVEGDGAIFMNLIGQVKVSGLTTLAISGKIASALADGYIINPKVTVFIKEFRSNKATVMGQVARPGLYELHGSTTFFELLSKAGGLTREAGDKATVNRKEEPGSAEKVVEINLKGLREKGETFVDIPIMGGDSIYIEKAGVFYVTGEVKKPDAYRHEEGISVIKAITRAGGMTDLGAQNSIKIIRKVGGEEIVMEKVTMDEKILSEDVIVVPESLF